MTSKSQLNFDPEAPPLTKKELKEAKKVLIHKFPKVTRTKFDPPIPNQDILNISFMFLEKPQNGVYGFFKPRGAYSLDANNKSKGADDRSEFLIKEVDSCHVIHQVNMGHWNPITNNEEYTLDQMDIQTKEQEIQLRDRAQKENHIKAQRQKREISEREEELRTNDKLDDPNSLEYYTTKQVSHHELKNYIKQGKEKLNDLKKKMRNIEKEIVVINKDHPTYVNQWLDLYNKERLKSGLPEVKESEFNNLNFVGPMVDDM